MPPVTREREPRVQQPVPSSRRLARQSTVVASETLRGYVTSREEAEHCVPVKDASRSADIDGAVYMPRLSRIVR